MPYKIVIGDKGKSWKLEISDESLSGKSLGERLEGKELKPEFEGYEFEIRGGSDSAGFPLSKDVEGIALKRVLLTKGWGMRDSRRGVRLRKTVRGKQITATTTQINLIVTKTGKKPLAEIFPEQNTLKEVPTAAPKAEVAVAA